MKKLLFLFFLLPLLASAQNGILPKAACDNIKAGLNAHEYTTTIQDVEAFYSGNDVFTAIGQIAGGIRGVSHEHPPAWFTQGDTTLTRAWTDSELLSWVVTKVQYQSRTFETYLLVNRRCTLVVGGQAFQGTQLLGSLSQQQADLQAFGLAVVAMFNYAQFDNLKN